MLKVIVALALWLPMDIFCIDHIGHMPKPWCCRPHNNYHLESTELLHIANGLLTVEFHRVRILNRMDNDKSLNIHGVHSLRPGQSCHVGLIACECLQAAQDMCQEMKIKIQKSTKQFDTLLCVRCTRLTKHWILGIAMYSHLLWYVNFDGCTNRDDQSPTLPLSTITWMVIDIPSFMCRHT